jgi:AcrR family transcriptional regulator
MKIADVEGGLAAVTMQAVSAQLGLTTMAVYRYFPNKEALYDAIVDAGMGLPPKPSDPPDEWRAEVTRWANAKRDMMCARPWLAELPFVAAPHGPNWLAWLEGLAAPLYRAGFRGELLGPTLRSHSRALVPRVSANSSGRRRSVRTLVAQSAIRDTPRLRRSLLPRPRVVRGTCTRGSISGCSACSMESRSTSGPAN